LGIRNRRHPGCDLLAFRSHERLNRLARIVDDERAAMREGVPAELASEGNVGQVLFGVRLKVRREIVNRPVGASFRLCRQRQQLARPRAA
jgi:hypothetical protein